MAIASDNTLATNKRLAVLIDADNVPRGTLKGIMEEIALYGTPTIKRIYGDWTSPNISGWKTSLLEHAVVPIQQYSYTTGKNSTDSAMIIDAMDILYTEKVDGFVLISSDSDFTRLAIRLREAGMTVIGIGEKKTPGPFIAACDKFIYVEVIRQHAAEVAETVTASSGKKSKVRANAGSGGKKLSKLERLEKIVAESVADLADLSDVGGYVYLGDLGTLLNKKMPDFDVRSYGFRSLSALVKSMGRLEVEFRPTADPNSKLPFVRVKEPG